MDFQDRVAVVTGAASGIGRALAVALAQRGAHLALVDLDAGGLTETAVLARAAGGGARRISAHAMDVADRDAVTLLPDRVHAEHGRTEILINNAGVALGGLFEQIREEDFDWLFEINFHAVVRMTRAFLPVLREAPRAHIVNVSSVYGMISPAGQAAYSASKFAVRGFSNALRHELEMEGAPIGLTVVHPGGISTGIARNARIAAGADPALVAARRAQAEKALRMPPARAAEIILAAVAKDAPRVLVGTDAKVAALLERLMPVGYWALLRKLVI